MMTGKEVEFKAGASTKRGRVARHYQNDLDRWLVEIESADGTGKIYTRGVDKVQVIDLERQGSGIALPMVSQHDGKNKCPICKCTDTTVRNTYKIQNAGQAETRRRCHCGPCNRNFMSRS